MRVIVLTSSTRGFGAYCLPRLAEADGIEVALVVYSQGQVPNRQRYWSRKLKKIRRIGLLGALNGYRMRSWFKEDVRNRLCVDDIRETAQRLGLRWETTPTINCPRTIELFQEADADLGLSLGNSYIAERVFSLPRYGMINVHHEVLPEYQGAQSVIWQIYNESDETGYTIHQIDRHIDTGRILYQERLPIDFQATLRETVIHNYARLYAASVPGLIESVKRYPELAAQAAPQGEGGHYTTPSFWQYLRMRRNHRALSARQPA